MDKDITVQIKSILEKNELDELNRSLNKRECLNRWNVPLIYIFNLTQSAGVLLTSVAASYNNKEMIWLGIGLNILASIINSFEKTNQGISKKLLANIKAIKEGTFVDEADLSEVVDKSKNNNDKPAVVNSDMVYNITNE